MMSVWILFGLSIGLFFAAVLMAQVIRPPFQVALLCTAWVIIVLAFLHAADLDPEFRSWFETMFHVKHQ